MAEDSQQATQDTPVPSVEQKSPEPSWNESEPDRETGASSQTETGKGLPDSASDRTKREFEKLREQLRGEREQKIRMQTALESYSVPQAPPIETESLYDPETGLIDANAMNKLQNVAYEAKARADRTEQVLQSFQQQKIADEDERQRQEAIVAHPELDSTKSKTFSKDLHVAVRRLIQDSMLNPEDYGGKSLSYKDAADIAKGVNKNVVDKAREEGASEAIEKLSPKEQAALEATGGPNRRDEVGAPLLELQYRTRKGGTDGLAAIAERLKSIPVVGRG